MAPKKRVARTVKETNNNDYKNLTLNNVLCPICRNILIEPVTLPCNHGFCLSCFEGTVANANLTCPLCRVRFGSWHRIAKKENRIINVPLWNAVQQNFPEQVKNRLEGVEENLDEDSQLIIRVASPGAIRREYESQKEKEQKQLQQEREAEEKASELLIKTLREQEEFEETIREEKLRLDEKVAKQLAEDMAVAPKACNSHNKSGNKSSVAGKKNTLDNFLANKQNNVQVLLGQANSPGNKNIPNHCKSKASCQNKTLPEYFSKSSTKTGIVNNVQKTLESADSANAVSDNEIDRECKYFKPIEPAKSTFKITPVKVPVKVKRISSVIFRSPKGKKDFSYKAINSPFVYFKPTHQFELIDLSYPEIINSKRKHSLKPSNQQKKVLKVAESHLNTMGNPVCSTIFPAIKRQCSENLAQGTKSSIRKVVVEPYPSSSKSYNTEASCSSWNTSRSNSPFRGFPISNSFLNSSDEDFEAQKHLQEKEDREYALRLHQELNSNGRLNSIKGNDTRKRKRQAKLEELVNPINTAK